MKFQEAMQIYKNGKKDIARPQFTVNDGFLLPMFFNIFLTLEKISLFNFIRFIDLVFWIKRNRITNAAVVPTNALVTKSYKFSEAWALGNLIFAIIAGTFGYLIDNSIIQGILMAYAVFRIFELFVYQANVLLFHPLINPNEYKIKSATRMVILLTMNMIEYTFWFSCIYSCLGFFFEGLQPEGFTFILQSFNTFTNLSNPAEISSEHFQLLAFVETLVGMFMNLICLARFIGILPSVKTVEDN